MSPTFSRLGFLQACAAAGGLLLLAGCLPATPLATAAAPEAGPTGQGVCIGRYDIILPTAARLRGRDQTVEHMRIETRPSAPSFEDGDAGGTQRLSHDTTLTVREIAEAGQMAETETRVRRRIGDRVFAVWGRHDTPLGIAAQRAAALDIAAALDTQAGAPGFCIDGGVVRRGFAWQEAASAGFEIGGGRIDIETASNGRTAASPSRALHDGLAGGIESLRDGFRRAAGHQGREQVLRAGDRLLMTWRHAGAPMSGTDPSIRIRWDAPAAEAMATLGAWDAMLASLRRRG